MPRPALITALIGFWFRPTAARPLALIRIAFAVAALANWLWLWKDRESLLLDGGLFHPDAIHTARYSLSLLAIFKSDAATTGFQLFGLSMIILLGIGLFTRLAAAGFYLYIMSVVPALFVAGSGLDWLQCTIGFILMLSPCNRALSLDAKWFPKCAGETVPAYPYRLLQWQFMLVFVTTAFLKSGTSSWHDGFEAGTFLLTDFSNFNTSFLVERPLLNLFFTHLTLVIELSVPFLLWHRRSRVLGYFLLLGLLTVIATAKVFVYGFNMFAMSLAFLEGRDLEALQRFAGLSPREKVRVFLQQLRIGVWHIFGATPTATPTNDVPR